MVLNDMPVTWKNGHWSTVSLFWIFLKTVVRKTVSGNRTLCGTIVCSFSLEGEMASNILEFILLRTLWSMGWLHGHEHSWDILVKLERISVESSLDSHLRNREDC